MTETTATATITREGWLLQAIEALRPLFAEQDVEVPTVRVSVGWPGGRGKKGNVIGQCWHPESATDGVGQVFVSPVLADAVEILAVLVHELVHAVNHANGENGHGACFSKIAKPLGLEGKMTSTVAGEALKATLTEIAETLGDFPHASLSSAAVGKKQSTRMLKVECPEDGYIVRTTAKWLEIGLPTCPCGTVMEPAL